MAMASIYRIDRRIDSNHAFYSSHCACQIVRKLRIRLCVSGRRSRAFADVPFADPFPYDHRQQVSHVCPIPLFAWTTFCARCGTDSVRRACNSWAVAV
jgi:hypothetical protein